MDLGALQEVAVPLPRKKNNKIVVFAYRGVKLRVEPSSDNLFWQLIYMISTHSYIVNMDRRRLLGL